MQLAPRVETARAPGVLWPLLREGISGPPRGQAGYREPCIRCPSRRRRVAPRCDSAKWSDQSLEGEALGEMQFRLQSRIVGAGFGEGFSSVRHGRFGRSDETQNLCAFTEAIRGRQRLLFQRNVLVTGCAKERCVSSAIRLPEHIAAHDAPATYRNPNLGSFVRSHNLLAGGECGRLYTGICSSRFALKRGWRPRARVRTKQSSRCAQG